MVGISQTFRELATRFRDIAQADSPDDARFHAGRIGKSAARTFAVACRDESFRRLFPSWRLPEASALGIPDWGAETLFAIIGKCANDYTLAPCDGAPRSGRDIPADTTESQLKSPGAKAYLQRDWRERYREYGHACEVLAGIADAVFNAAGAADETNEATDDDALLSATRLAELAGVEVEKLRKTTGAMAECQYGWLGGEHRTRAE